MTEVPTDSTTSQDSEDNFIPTRNYTDPDEKYQWWSLRNWWQGFIKQDFRMRRGPYWSGRSKRGIRMCVGNSNDIGAFVRLTNSYMLVGGQEESENFCRLVENDVYEIPVIRTTLAGCRVAGPLCVGNKHGLILPDCVYDTEFQKIKAELPESVEIRKIEEQLSALGNVVVCNDHVALIHPDLDKESEEIIANTLQVEVFRHCIADSPLVGSFCVLNNNGGLVRKDISANELENLSSLLQLPLAPGTVNHGNKAIASGLCASDAITYAGMKTTGNEFAVIDSIFYP